MPLSLKCDCGKVLNAREEHAGKRAKCPACGAFLTIPGKPLPIYQVFISYSQGDAPTANAICAALEANGVRCWIAPRDITPGQEWGAAIIDGITACRVMVLVFSDHSNRSPQVCREIERAVNKGLTIIPFRLEDIPMSKTMEYFLSSPHWLDALTPPLEEHLVKLVGTVGLSLGDNARPTKRKAGDIPSAKPNKLSATAQTSSHNALPIEKAKLRSARIFLGCGGLLTLSITTTFALLALIPAVTVRERTPPSVDLVATADKAADDAAATALPDDELVAAESLQTADPIEELPSEGEPGVFARSRVSANRTDASRTEDMPPLADNGAPASSVKSGRAARPQRWVLHLNTTRVKDYLAQYESLGAEIAFPTSADKYRYFSNLTSSPPTSEVRDLSDERRVYWIDDDRESVGRVARALETPATDFFIAFLPADLEERMLKLELDTAGVPEADIASTHFVVVPRGALYDVQILKQTLK